MKILGKRIYKGTMVVFADFLLLTVCCILITTNLYVKDQTEKVSRGFYSDHVLSIQVSSHSTKNFPASFFEGMPDSVIFRTGLSMEYDLRGVFWRGKTQLPPLLSGRFFSEEEGRMMSRVAVAGESCLENAYKENGKTYISIQGQPFEVIGIMGTKEKSRFQSMIWIPFETAISVFGVDGQYKVDGADLKMIQESAEYLERELSKTAQVTIEEPVGMEVSGVGERLDLGTNDLIRMVYLAIMAAFLLAGILCVSYWIGYQRPKMQVRHILGEADWHIGLHLGGYLMKTVVLAVMVGGVFCACLYQAGFLAGFRIVDMGIASGTTMAIALLIGGVELGWNLWRRREGR